jgi:hypothetical protein
MGPTGVSSLFWISNNSDERKKTMKLIKFVVVVFLLFSFSIAVAHPFKGIGIKAGINFSNQDFQYEESWMNQDYDNITALTFGGYVEWLTSSYYSIQTEVYFIQKGMSNKINVTTEISPDAIGTMNIDNHINYISVPILGKIAFTHRRINPFVTLGPRFDFLLSYSSDKNAYNLVYDDFKTFVFGGDLGIRF